MNCMNEVTRRMDFDEETHTYKDGDIILPSVTEIIAPITAKKYAVSSAVVAQAAFRGSMVHALCADYDRGELGEDLSADVAPYLQAWIAFCHDYSPCWEYVELPLGCDYFAGTVDRVGVIDGKRVIVDIKTSSGMDRAAKLSVGAQIYGYAYLCTVNGILDVRPMDSLGVHLKKDGTYTAYKVMDIENKYNVNTAELFDKCHEISRIVRGR